MKLLLLVLPLLGTCFGFVIKPCPDGWSLLYESNQCFKLLAEQKSWSDARRSCRSMSAHLADIPNQLANTFMADTITNASEYSYWLGLSDFTHEGKFKWWNGRAAIFMNWGPGEPNNGNGTENCVQFRKAKWYDADCEQKRGYLCQRPADTRSCPDGWSLLDKADQCFQMFREPKSIVNASSFCQTYKGGHLPYIPDIETNTFLTDMALKNPGSYWLGLHYLPGKVRYEWFNRKQVTFEKWQSGGRNTLNGHKDCVEFLQGQWNGVSCTALRAYFCQAQVTYPPAKMACPDGWSLNRRRHTCLKAFTSEKNWDNARLICQSYAGDLAVIIDSQSNDYLKRLPNKPSAEYWIGLNDMEREGTYRWLESHSSRSFSQWAKGSRGISTHQNDCVKFLQDGTWTDAHCQDKNGFICEIKAYK